MFYPYHIPICIFKKPSYISHYEMRYGLEYGMHFCSEKTKESNLFLLNTCLWNSRYVNKHSLEPFWWLNLRKRLGVRYKLEKKFKFSILRRIIPCRITISKILVWSILFSTLILLIVDTKFSGLIVCLPFPWDTCLTNYHLYMYE